MDDPQPAWLGVVIGAAVLHAFTAHARVAFRFLSPVTLEALAHRSGAARTAFLRKSLRAPTAFYFALHLTNVLTQILLVVAVLAADFSLPRPGRGVLRLGLTGRPLHDGALALGLFAFVTLVAYVLPAGLTRALGVDRLAFMERSLPLMRVAHVALAPLTRLLAAWSDDEPNGTEEDASDENLDAYIGVGTREGILEEGEGELVRNVLEFGDTRVREVMTPRTDIVGIGSDATISQVAELMSSSRYSRIPVHEGQLDEIVGVVSIKDVVPALQAGQGEHPVTTLVKPTCVVPESKRVADLLKDLQARRLQVAIVIDEYGGTAGLATVEDLLEEIVGEIREEHEEGDDLEDCPEGGWLVRGSANVHDVAVRLDGDLAADESASVAGLLLTLFDRVPQPGESIEHAGFKFEVREADRKRVHLVHVLRVGAAGETVPPAQDGAA